MSRSATNHRKYCLLSNSAGDYAPRKLVSHGVTRIFGHWSSERCLGFSIDRSKSPILGHWVQVNRSRVGGHPTGVAYCIAGSSGGPGPDPSRIIVKGFGNVGLRFCPRPSSKGCKSWRCRTLPWQRTARWSRTARYEEYKSAQHNRIPAAKQRESRREQSPGRTFEAQRAHSDEYRVPRSQKRQARGRTPCRSRSLPQ